VLGVEQNSLLYIAKAKFKNNPRKNCTVRSAFWHNSWVVGKIHGCVNNNLACMQKGLGVFARSYK
jgi:hypothetical protein